MQPFRLTRFGRHWLLALALLWAQMLAGAHTVSHLGERSDDGLAAQCELCLAAASLSTPAPTPEPPALALLATRHERALHARPDSATPTPAWTPPARAPPLSA